MERCIVVTIALLLACFLAFYEKRNPALVKDVKALEFYQEVVKPLEKYDPGLAVAIDMPKTDHYAVLINCRTREQYKSAVEAAKKIKKQLLIQYQIFYGKEVSLIDVNKIEVLK